tara:strand:- start:421 stop:672 length:252 start_codon:yes stop_codon:yes gene_type:complete
MRTIFDQHRNRAHKRAPYGSLFSWGQLLICLFQMFLPPKSELLQATTFRVFPMNNTIFERSWKFQVKYRIAWIAFHLHDKRTR